MGKEMKFIGNGYGIKYARDVRNSIPETVLNEICLTTRDYIVSWPEKFSRFRRTGGTSILRAFCHAQVGHFLLKEKKHENNKHPEQ